MSNASIPVVFGLVLDAQFFRAVAYCRLALGDDKKVTGVYVNYRSGNIVEFRGSPAEMIALCDAVEGYHDDLSEYHIRRTLLGRTDN